jgi:hypothetical protein
MTPEHRHMTYDDDTEIWKRRETEIWHGAERKSTGVEDLVQLVV